MSHAPRMSATDWCKGAPEGLHWRLWGKASPGLEATVPAHPLLYHMVDVGMTAEVMLRRCVPDALRRRLLQPMGTSEQNAIGFLSWIVALHDFGKATPAFQAKAEISQVSRDAGLPFEVREKDLDHGRIGLELLRGAIEERIGSLALPLARSVVAHHGLFPTDFDLDPRPRESGGTRWLQVRNDLLREISSGCTFVEVPSHDLAGDRTWMLLLAGLTCVADWVGSMTEFFPYQVPEQPLIDYAAASRARAERALSAIGMVQSSGPGPTGFRALFPGFEPWPLHEVADRVASRLRGPTLVVVEAPMGEGKTETALTLAESARTAAGCTGLFIGLPSQATANQMLGRVDRFLRHARSGQVSQLMLAHGEASLVEAFQKLVRAVYDPEGGGEVRAGGWFLKSKRALLASHAVGTIDQALMGVLRIRHGFVRLTGLAGKVVVLDEVHAYDTFTSTLLDRLVEWLASMGCTVVLLSATLPSNRRDALVHAWRTGRGGTDRVTSNPTPYPRVTVCGDDGVAVSSFEPRSKPFVVRMEHEQDDLESLVRVLLQRLEGGGCAGWICNTVMRAQRVVAAVKEAAPELAVLLVHARMLPDERRRREVVLLEWLGRQGRRPDRCLVVGTQVLEQSLDVDFDWLRTDVAPMDLLLQRAGRLHRHRRDQRPEQHRQPRLSVVVPFGSWHDADLRGIAKVYVGNDEWIMRRTLRLLEGRNEIRLPTEIEPLVEAAYVQPDPPGVAERMRAFKEDHRRTCEEHKLAARRGLLPSPKDPEDFLADLTAELLDDEDPEIHRSLQAVTRLGPPSVDVVCLHVRDGQHFLDEDGAQAVDLESDPTPRVVDQLVRRSIGISNPPLVAHFLAVPVPAGWRGQALLCYRRPLAFEGKGVEVAGVLLRLDRELGLVIESGHR